MPETSEISQEPGNNREIGYGRPPVEHRFQRGNRANPAGRPKGRSLMARLREALEAVESDGGQAADRVVKGLIEGAAKGDSRCIAILFDRVEGKVPDRIAVVDPRGEPLFPPDRQQEVLKDPRATELVCQLDEYLAGPEPAG